MNPTGLCEKGRWIESLRDVLCRTAGFGLEEVGERRHNTLVCRLSSVGRATLL